MITIMGIMWRHMVPFYYLDIVFTSANSINMGVWILYFLYSYAKI